MEIPVDSTTEKRSPEVTGGGGGGRVNLAFWSDELMDKDVKNGDGLFTTANASGNNNDEKKALEAEGCAPKRKFRKSTQIMAALAGNFQLLLHFFL